MTDAVGRMRSLIQDLLGFARVGRAAASPQPVALAEVLRQAEQNVQSALEETGGELSWEADQTVPGHPGLLAQLLTNLISNAHKYGRAPFEVRVRAHGERVCIDVVDHGPGVPPGFQDQLFREFARADGAVTTGTGLGLYVVRTLARAQNGDITYAPLPEGGSVFTISLLAE